MRVYYHKHIPDTQVWITHQHFSYICTYTHIPSPCLQHNTGVTWFTPLHVQCHVDRSHTPSLHEGHKHARIG